MTQSTLYAVMRAISWDGVEAGGHQMKAPPDGPQRFIPVFDTEDQAIAWANDGDAIWPIVAKAPVEAVHD